MAYPTVTDVIRRTQNARGRTLDVRPSPDDPALVALMSPGADNEEWFGKVNLMMEPEFARLLGAALIKCADELTALNPGEKSL